MTTRKYSNGMDFLYLGSNCILMAAPQTEEQARKYSEFIVKKYRHYNRVVDCTSSEYASYFASNSENYLGPSYYNSIVRYESEFLLTMKQLLHFTHNTEDWLHKNSKGVLIIVDEDGVGKSAVAAACLMLHLGTMHSASEAIDFINKERTPDSPPESKAISHPSHIRFVYYYESLLTHEETRFQNKTLQLCGVRFTGDIPNYQRSLIKYGFNPHIHVNTIVHEVRRSSLAEDVSSKIRNSKIDAISAKHKVVSKLGEGSEEMAASVKRTYTVERFDQLEQQYQGKYEAIPFYNRSEYATVAVDVSDFDIIVRDEVVVDVYSEEIKIASLSFHTAFVDNCYLEFDKPYIDILCEDVSHHLCNSETKIALLFAPTVDRPEYNVVDEQIYSGRERQQTFMESAFTLMETPSDAEEEEKKEGEEGEEGEGDKPEGENEGKDKDENEEGSGRDVRVKFAEEEEEVDMIEIPQ